VANPAQAGRAGLRLARHGRSVVLRISDDGRGFLAPGHLSSVPQSRVESPRYGLSGMYERVHLIGGQLSVSSTPGEGCVVEVVVPDLLD
jgi:two-component system sensor histidine kinase DegS